MIKYLGSKRLLIPHILQMVAKYAPKTQSVLDLFSGTSRVGHAFKAEGYQVFANDYNHYAYILAKCYVETDAGKLEEEANRIIAELNTLPGESAFFTHTYCENARFFHPKNGAKIDSMRRRIEEMALGPDLFAVVMVSLMEAADRVDSTCGIQMAYLKEWAPRALKDIELRLPKLLPASPYGSSQAFLGDAREQIKTLQADLIYMDPPYNQHSYLGNYHIWETLVRFDKPELYGKARKRTEVLERKSPFNSKIQFMQAFSGLVRDAQCKTLLVSFNNEGFISEEEMKALLESRGRVQVFAVDYKRYVGAQIGIYNPAGKRVGQVKNLYNKELLFWVDL